MRLDTTKRKFWARIDASGGPDACWPWLGIKSKKGYGEIKTLGERVAHRLAYRLMVGDIPTGLTLDHLCRNRSCCNPAHLEPVTSAVNSLRGTNPLALNKRKTHCIRGHEFTPENTKVFGPGYRSCRECQRARGRLWARTHYIPAA